MPLRGGPVPESLALTSLLVMGACRGISTILLVASVHTEIDNIVGGEGITVIVGVTVVDSTVGRGVDIAADTEAGVTVDNVTGCGVVIDNDTVTGVEVGGEITSGADGGTRGTAEGVVTIGADTGTEVGTLTVPGTGA